MGGRLPAPSVFLQPSVIKNRFPQYQKVVPLKGGMPFVHQPPTDWLKGQRSVNHQAVGLTLMVPFQIRCGDGWHEVTVTLMAWGMVEIFSPCQFLPKTVLSLTKSDCLKRFPELQAKLAQGFYDDEWKTPESDSFSTDSSDSRKLSWFLAYWRQNLSEAARQCLKERFDFEVKGSKGVQKASEEDRPNFLCATSILAGTRKDKTMTVSLIRWAERSKNLCVQLAALWALTEIASVLAIPFLTQWLRKDFLSPSLKAKVIRALGQTGDSRAFEPISEMLRSKNPTLRQAAAEALGQIKDHRAVEPLLLSLQDTDDSVRMAAIRALGQIGDAQVVLSLLKALWDENEKVRRIAEWALVQIGSPVIPSLYETLWHDNGCIRMSALRVLRALGEFIPLSEWDLMEPDWQVRLAKAVGKEASIKPLLKSLQDGNEEVRKGVMEALAQIGQSAVKPLLEMLREWDIKGKGWEAALLTLVQIGQPAVEPLKEALQDKNAFVRKTVEWALRQIQSKEGR